QAGELRSADQAASRAAAEAERLGDRAVAIEAALAHAQIQLSVDTNIAFGTAIETAEQLLAQAQEVGEPAALARAWHWVGQTRFWSGDSAGSLEAGRKAAEAA